MIKKRLLSQKEFNCTLVTWLTMKCKLQFNVHCQQVRRLKFICCPVKFHLPCTHMYNGYYLKYSHQFWNVGLQIEIRGCPARQVQSNIVLPSSCFLLILLITPPNWFLQHWSADFSRKCPSFLKPSLLKSPPVAKRHIQGGHTQVKVKFPVISLCLHFFPCVFFKCKNITI